MLYEDISKETHEDFHKAIRNNDFANIKNIIKHHPAIVNETSLKGVPYLHLVIQLCSFNVFLHFVREKCDLRQSNEHKNTVLHIAAYYNNQKVLKYLLRYKEGDINAQDNLGYTALHHAAYNNNIDSCEMLLQFNINKRLKHVQGSTAYDVAIRNGRFQSAELIKKFKSSESNLLMLIENEELEIEDEIRKENNIETVKRLASKMAIREKDLNDFFEMKKVETDLETQLLESKNVIKEEKERSKFLQQNLKRISHREKKLNSSFEKIDKELKDLELILERVDGKGYHKCEICERLPTTLNCIFKCLKSGHRICRDCKDDKLMKSCPFCENGDVENNKSVSKMALKHLLKEF